MASAFTHALVGLAIGTAFRRPKDPTRFWVLGAVGAALPDIDAMTTAAGASRSSRRS